MANIKRIGLLSILALISLTAIVSIIFLYVPHKKTVFTVFATPPQHNFIYAVMSTQTLHQCTRQLKTIIYPSKTKKNAQKNDLTICGKFDLFIYNFERDNVEKIALEQAQQLNLLPQTELHSPDGFSIVTNCTKNANLEWTGEVYHYNDVCVHKDNYEQQLNIKYPSNNGETAFVFLGWIQKPTTTSNAN